MSEGLPLFLITTPATTPREPDNDCVVTMGWNSHNGLASLHNLGVDSDGVGGGGGGGHVIYCASAAF